MASESAADAPRTIQHGSHMDLVMERYGFNPNHFLQEVTDSVNEAVADSIQVLEMSIRGGLGEDVVSTTEFEDGLQSLETSLFQATDIATDMFETFIPGVLFAVPPDLPSVALPELEGMDFTASENELDEEISALEKTLTNNIVYLQFLRDHKKEVSEDIRRVNQVHAICTSVADKTSRHPMWPTSQSFNELAALVREAVDLKDYVELRQRNPAISRKIREMASDNKVIQDNVMQYLKLKQEQAAQAPNEGLASINKPTDPRILATIDTDSYGVEQILGSIAS
ncbi:uncharacterized protein BJ171DRAFT_600727 [Polychytrium aggregatum]|uniref:uncharacterized protein n=1 Tax=Polychytrium aggregatum TaxID=110093 RepID=UPI0022FE87C9|nr:uncharacterized protein BJ171DRAFT_600727 [Polychytrium aggregatum]KAI9202722.1 hypothetical protein BJ171DRAFT_600727 [Polychytrium aggregatum]